jgi:GNAT superfamily N-acetyltransferase
MSQFEEYTPDKNRHDKQEILRKMTIREANLRDCNKLARLQLARAPDNYDKVLAKFKNEISGLSHLNKLLMIAEMEQVIIGYARASYFIPSDYQDSRNCPEGWYLAGVLIDQAYRRLGVASAFTSYRLDWIAERADKAYYFANAQNRVSIELHQKFGFEELTRDFVYPKVEFEGGDGILFVVNLAKH